MLLTENKKTDIDCEFLMKCNLFSTLMAWTSAIVTSLIWAAANPWVLYFKEDSFDLELWAHSDNFWYWMTGKNINWKVLIVSQQKNIYLFIPFQRIQLSSYRDFLKVATSQILSYICKNYFYKVYFLTELRRKFLNKVINLKPMKLTKPKPHNF